MHESSRLKEHHWDRGRPARNSREARADVRGAYVSKSRTRDYLDTKPRPLFPFTGDRTQKEEELAIDNQIDAKNSHRDGRRLAQGV
jgi:hypothetical protein